MAAIKAEAAPYLEAFRGDPAEPAWLADMRAKSLAAFGERGFPTRRDEAWRFTSTRPLTEKFFIPVRREPVRRDLAIPANDDADIGKYGFKGPTYRVVFANGIAQGLPRKLPPGLWLGSITQAVSGRPEAAKLAISETDLRGNQPFASLNAALFADGFVLELDEGIILDRPIEIVHRAQSALPTSIYLRNAIRIAPGSKVTVMETYVGEGAYWDNVVTSIAVAEGASLTHVNIQDESREAVHFATVRTSVEQSASYQNFSLTLGANLSRNDIQVLLGEGATVNVAGAYLQRGDQDTTNAVVIDHAEPNATTRELFKGVLDGRSHGAFLGTIRVREGAQKTDAKQTSRALMLSDRASVNIKPELSILADDVKCSHGAAVGDLDKDTLFYLRARGIGVDEARRMLVEAFLLETIDTLESPETQEHLARHVRRWLAVEEA
jgi:Fe-S cluster assembly protein SufD